MNFKVIKSFAFVLVVYCNVSIANEGVYLGARIGTSNFQDACPSNTIDCDTDEFGYGVYLGYDITQHIAFELGANHYGLPSATYNNNEAKTEHLGAEFSIKLGSYFIENTNLYTRLGAVYQKIDKTSNNKKTNNLDLDPLVALGGEYKINDSLSIRGEYQYVDGVGVSSIEKSDLHFISLGLSYYFNNTPPIKNTTNSVIKNTPPSTLITSNHIFNTIISDSFFSTNSDELEHIDAFKELLAWVSSKDVYQVKIVGHTDNVGSDLYNMELSKRRAESVKNYLLDNGIDEKNIEIKWEGEYNPIATNNTFNGRAQNRRVEVVIKSREQVK